MTAPHSAAGLASTVETERQATRRVLEAARIASDEARAAYTTGTGSYEALVAAGRAEMAATHAWVDTTWLPGLARDTTEAVEPAFAAETEGATD